MRLIARFTFNPDPNATNIVAIEAIGHTGPSCLTTTKPYEDALGAVATRTATNDMHRHAGASLSTVTTIKASS